MKTRYLVCTACFCLMGSGSLRVFRDVFVCACVYTHVTVVRVKCLTNPSVCATRNDIINRLACSMIYTPYTIYKHKSTALCNNNKLGAHITLTVYMRLRRESRFVGLCLVIFRNPSLRPFLQYIRTYAQDIPST